MSRVQLSLNVSDLDAAVSFYTRLLGTPPAWEYYIVLEHVETP